MVVSDLEAATKRAAAMTAGELRAIIAEAPWTFARTMPESPHWYTLRARNREGDFEAFVLYIRANGYQGRFGGATYTYLDVDGWTYWTMGAPVAETTLINRREAQRTAVPHTSDR